MIVTGIRDSIRGAILQKAHRYERLALKARQNPTLQRLGYTVAGLFMFLGMMDVLSTEWALSVGAYELNGFMRSLQETMGSIWYLPKLALQATVAAMIVWSPNKATIAIMTCMCGWTSSVVTNNFVIAYNLSL